MSRISYSSVASLKRLPFFGTCFIRLESSPIASKMAAGIFWSVVGGVLSRLSVLGSAMITARLIGREGYGELGMIQSTIGAFGILSTFGLGYTATKYIAELKGKDPQRAGKIVALSTCVASSFGFLVAILLFLFAPWLSSHILAAPNLSMLLQLGAGVLLFTALNAAQNGALSGLESYRRLAQINFWSAVGSFPLIVGGAYAEGVKGITCGLVLNAALTWLISHFVLRRELKKADIPITYRECWVERKILWKFSFPATISSLLVSPVLWMCSAMLANQPSGYAQMGLYNAASQWRNAVLFIPSLISNIVLPTLSALAAIDEHEKSKQVFKINILVNAAAAAVPTVVIILFSGFILRLYGVGFEEGRPALILLCLACVLMAVTNVVGQAIASIGRAWHGLAFNLIWATIQVVSFQLLLKIGYRATGLALATLISYSFHVCFQMIYMLKYYRVKGNSNNAA